MNICSTGQKNKYKLIIKERTVLSLMKEGFSNVQSSEKLKTSKDGIYEDKRAIFFKLKVQNRIQAVVKAVKENLL